MAILGLLHQMVRRSDELFAGGLLPTAYRHLKWQLAARIWGGELVIDFVSGAKLIARQGVTEASSQYYFGLDETAASPFLLHALRPEDLFLDVGANIGVYTVLASAACGATTIACEPSASNFDLLDRNVQINGVGGRVRLHRAAVGAAPGRIEMELGQGAVNQVAHGGGAPTETVAMTTVDDLCPEGVDFAKVDVVGFEEPVLKGAHRTLSNPRLRAIILGAQRRAADFSLEPSAITEITRSYGLQPAIYHAADRTLRALDEPEFDRECIYVRDFDWARQRLATGRPFTVRGRAY